MLMILPILSAALYAVAIALFFRLHLGNPPGTWLNTPLSNGALTPAKKMFAVYGHIGTAAAIFPPLKRFFGLLERVFLRCTVLWFFTAGIALITMPSP